MIMIMPLNSLYMFRLAHWHAPAPAARARAVATNSIANGHDARHARVRTSSRGFVHVMIMAMAWLPHTTRAPLAPLRHVHAVSLPQTATAHELQHALYLDAGGASCGAGHLG